MADNPKILFIGEFPPPFGGVTIKNRMLQDQILDVQEGQLFDLYEFKRRNHFIVNVFLDLVKKIRRADRVVIGVGSNPRLVLILRLIVWLKGKRFLEQVTVFVMGSTLPEFLSDHPSKLHLFRRVRCFFVESQTLVAQLAETSLRNTKFLPNVRSNDQTQYPHPTGRIVHFVFFAKVCAEKGVPAILEAVKNLNLKGFAPYFDISFYGPVPECFREQFFDELELCDNAKYFGVFDATTGDILNELSQYDVSVSSSLREGMSGTNIESKFAGIASITSNAGFNTECINHGVDGIIVKPSDVGDLVDAMSLLVTNHDLLDSMKRSSFASRTQYDVTNWRKVVLNEIARY